MRSVKAFPAALWVLIKVLQGSSGGLYLSVVMCLWCTVNKGTRLMGPLRTAHSRNTLRPLWLIHSLIYEEQSFREAFTQFHVVHLFFKATLTYILWSGQDVSAALLFTAPDWLLSCLPVIGHITLWKGANHLVKSCFKDWFCYLEISKSFVPS